MKNKFMLIRRLLIVATVFIGAITLNHVTHAQSTAPTAGVVEKVSTSNRTITISNRIYSYSSSTLMVNELGLSKSNRTIKQFTPGTNVQFYFVDGKPLAKLKMLQMIQL